MADQPAPIRRLAQVAIVVQDLARATAFYRDTLRLPFLFQAPPGMAFFDCGGVRLMLSLPESSVEVGTSVLYYLVDEIQAAVADLEARGVTFERRAERVARLADREIWLAFLKDSEGNLVALMSEPPLSPS